MFITFLQLMIRKRLGSISNKLLRSFSKRFLLSHGWALERIHDLEPLLNEALTFDTSLEAYRSVVQKITGMYFVERYPLMLEAGLSEKDVADALEQVTGLLDAIRDYLK